MIKNRKKILIILTMLGIMACCLNVPCIAESFVNENTDIVAVGEWKGLDFLSEIKIKGVYPTKDIPWGKTAGIIEEESIGECILLTPGTSMEFNIIRGDKKYIQISWMIHPWVSANSDGAEIVVDVFEKGTETPMITECYYLKKSDNFFECNLDVSILKAEELYLKLSCNGGPDGNEDSDWVILDKVIAKNNIETEFWKSVHYFSDEWPINFWNSEMIFLSKELSQIKEDGFNSIILVIPWREFQPGLNPVTYNNYAFDNLNKVMSEASKLDLGVFVRIGYTWDLLDSNENDVSERFYQIMGDNNVKKAWMCYAERLYTELSNYSNFKGGFITWEDFWNVSYLPGKIGGKEESINEAKFTGYQNYLSENYTLEEINGIYKKKYGSFEEILIPDKTDPMMQTWYEFYDMFLIHLLEETQTVFKNLSMEIRNDWDIIYDSDGNQKWYSHEITYKCGNADFTSAMYGIPQGSENKGEELTADEAAKLTKSILKSISDANSGKDIYIEQFLYYDNTPKFSMNAKLKADDIGTYLENIDCVLKEYGCGYGLWVYRNYKTNLLYNPHFALGLSGWHVENNNVKVKTVNENKILYLPAMERLSQNIPSLRNHFSLSKYFVEMDISSEFEGELTIALGNLEQMIHFNTGERHIKISFDNPSNYDFSILSTQNILVDNIKVYNMVQDGLLYDADGNELDQIKSIRILNEKLN